jgi:DsbC/DsbD-like thiol-disulfide interchange protein
MAMHRFNAFRRLRVSCRAVLAPAAIFIAGGVPIATAGEPAPAYKAPHTLIRLLPGGALDWGASKARFAGIEIVLEPGWKTYWRTPGEGIPPSFSWDESANLKTAEVLWPAPVRFVEAEGTSIGYKQRVVLPVLVTPEDEAKPVSLNLAVAYGICKDICMPVEAALTLDMDMPAKASDREALVEALIRVPKRQEPGAACPHRFLSAKLAGNGAATVLRVETAFEEGAQGRDLLVEADPESGLGTPAPQPENVPGRAAYLLPVPAESAGLLKAKPLTFTTVSDRGSCESIAPVE